MVLIKNIPPSFDCASLPSRWLVDSRLIVCPQLIQLGRDTYEFKEVARLYERTMDHPIKSIQRIQNLDLWEFFCRYTMVVLLWAYRTVLSFDRSSDSEGFPFKGSVMSWEVFDREVCKRRRESLAVNLKSCIQTVCQKIEVHVIPKHKT